MYNYKARIYSPTLGRFMQTDPIGYGDGMNWYNYVGSDPVNLVDPSGKVALGSSCTLVVQSYTIWRYDSDGDGIGQPTDPFAFLTPNYIPECTNGGQEDNSSRYLNGQIVVNAGKPQNKPPCSMPADVGRFYGDVRQGAFERFRANGSDKEIAYTIYRNNDSGSLIAYFEVGTGASGWGPWAKPGGVAPTIDRPGLTPLLVGHIHDLPAGPCGLFCSSPRGASEGDIGSKAYYPRGTQFVLHQQVLGEWQDSCF